MPESRADHGQSQDAMSVRKVPAPPSQPEDAEPEGKDQDAPAEVTPRPE